MAKVVIGEDDKRVLIKDVMRHPGFELIVNKFEDEINRLIGVMLNPNTEDTETILIKGAIHKLRQVSPESIITKLLKNYEARLAKSNSGLVKITKMRLIKPDQLPAATTVGADDLFIIHQDGVTKQVTLAVLQTALGSGGGGGMTAHQNHHLRQLHLPLALLRLVPLALLRLAPLARLRLVHR